MTQYNDPDVGAFDNPLIEDQNLMNDNDVDVQPEIDAEVESTLFGVNDLPEFANADAHKIHNDNLTKEEEIEKIDVDIGNMKERFKVMRDHFKNVQQEVEHINALYNAKQKEIKTEIHLKQLASRSLGKSQEESKKISQEIDFLKDQLNQIQKQIYKATEKMDEFKMQMNWNQEELEQWAIASKQKEEDYLVIEKYRRADEQKIKNLTLQLEQLTKEYLEEKLNLENEATDTMAKQMELDRIANDFKIAHQERQDLVAKWQETIAESRKRDLEINAYGERFSKAKAERIKKQEILTHQKKRVSNQISENKEIELKSESLNRIVLRKMEELMELSTHLSEFEGELGSLKNELTMTAEKLMLKKQNNINKANMVEELKVQLDRERQKYQMIKAKIERAKDSNVKAEEKAKQAEEELTEKEKELNNEISRLKILKEKAIKESQIIFELKSEETRLRSDISGNKLISRNLEGQLNQLDKEAARQQELLYNAEFQIQQIERKIARGMGERSDEEKIDLKKQISALEVQLDEIKEKRKILQQQNRRLQNELAQLKTRKEDLESRKVKLDEQLGEKQLENKMIEEEIKRDTKVYEDLTVQNDLLLLEVKRLKDLLSAKTDAVFSLENRKQQLILSMEERKAEISAHKEILRAELKALSDDKHRITLELKQRQTNVEKLKTRFQVMSSQDQLDENGEKHSQAYYVIKAAQKREELQRLGDQLDQDIRKCEREIRALTTTLDHLNARNVAFRESFQKLDPKSLSSNGTSNGMTDVEILQQLEDKIRTSKDSLFRKKRELQRILTDIEEDSRRLEQVNSQCEKIMKQRDHFLQAKNQVEEEIQTQSQLFNELGDRMNKIVAKHNNKRSENNQSANAALELKIVQSEITRDVVQNVLYTLGQLSMEFPEITESLNSKLQEVDLRLPLKPMGRASLTVSSATSSSATSSNRRVNESPANNGTYLQPKSFGLAL